MALYLGTNKIAGNITSIIQEGEVEIPEISEQNLFLADLDDGIYKCHYMFWWASQEEKEASMSTGLLTDYSDCILIKYTLPITEIILGQVCYPFSVRMIHTDYDIVVNVGSDGMRAAAYSMSISEFETLQNDARSMSSKITTLESIPTNKMILVDILNGSFISRQDMTITAGMTWQDVIDDTDFLNYDGAFDAPEGDVQWNYYLLYYDSNGYVTVKPDDQIRDGGVYYSVRSANFPE